MKHPRMRSFKPLAKLSFDDLQRLADLLREVFPDAVYFCGNYKSGNRLPPQYPTDKPIEFYDDLADGVRHFGNWAWRPRINFRVPWPEEAASGDPEELIGGRWEPTYEVDSARWRKFGRCAYVLFEAGDYVDARTYRTGRDDSPPLIEQRGTLPASAYPPFSVLSGMHSQLVGAYDADDPETTVFFKRVHALWRRLVTWKTALYNPITGEISPASKGYDFGKLALAAAVDGSKRYPAFERAQKGAALMVGPLPKKPRPAKTEAHKGKSTA